jgi:hypothetical protein
LLYRLRPTNTEVNGHRFFIRWQILFRIQAGEKQKFKASCEFVHNAFWLTSDEKTAQLKTLFELFSNRNVTTPSPGPELVRGMSYLALIVIPVKFFPYLAHIVIPLKNASACI